MCFHPDPESWVTGAYIKIGFFATEAVLFPARRFQGIVVERRCP